MKKERLKPSQVARRNAELGRVEGEKTESQKLRDQIAALTKLAEAKEAEEAFAAHKAASEAAEAAQAEAKAAADKARRADLKAKATKRALPADAPTGDDSQG